MTKIKTIHEQLLITQKIVLGEFPQCESCQYYKELKGELGMDWGGCINQKSEYFGKLVFEHNNCKHHNK
jgi:hypothetical protein